MYGLILVAIVFRDRLMTGETISHSLEMQEKISVLQEKAFWLKSHILKFTAPASGSALLQQQGEERRASLAGLCRTLAEAIPEFCSSCFMG